MLDEDATGVTDPTPPDQDIVAVDAALDGLAGITDASLTNPLNAGWSVQPVLADQLPACDYEDIEDKEDFNVWDRKRYDDYSQDRLLNGTSHKTACKKLGISHDSELGEALERVYKKEIRGNN